MGLLVLFVSPVGAADISRKVIISDLHLGSGPTLGDKPNKLEDFPFDEQFREFLQGLQDEPTELVIAGDFIDFWQVMPQLNLKGGRASGSTVNDSMLKVRAVIAAHQRVFKSLGDFASYFPDNRIVIIPGNHDVDLSWPDVQQEVRRATGIKETDKLVFVLGGYRDNQVWIEHGHQHDTLNRFRDVSRPWSRKNGERRLDINWGTEFVHEFFNKIEERWEFLDNLVPTIPDAVWLALRREPRLAREIPNLFRFMAHAKRTRSALVALGREVLLEGEGSSAPPRDARSVFREFKGIPDPFISYAKEAYERDEGFREALDQQFRQLSEDERRALGIPITFREQPTTTLDVAGLDPYVEAAKRAKARERVKIVVFGHTHEATVYPLNTQAPVYLNSGCWIQTLPVARAQTVDWNELKLDNHSVFPVCFSWVLIVYNEAGEPQAMQRSWGPGCK